MKSPVVVKNCKGNHHVKKILFGKIEPLRKKMTYGLLRTGTRWQGRHGTGGEGVVGRGGANQKRLPAFCLSGALQRRWTKQNNCAVVADCACSTSTTRNDPEGREFLDPKGKLKELGVVMAHITPSTRGLRYVFRRPQGMDIDSQGTDMVQARGLEHNRLTPAQRIYKKYRLPSRYRKNIPAEKVPRGWKHDGFAFRRIQKGEIVQDEGGLRVQVSKRGRFIPNSGNFKIWEKIVGEIKRSDRNQEIESGGIGITEKS